MKRTIVFLLVLAMCLSLCACGEKGVLENNNVQAEVSQDINIENEDKSEKAKKVEQLISSLDPTSLSCDEAIKNAEREYSYLTDDEKKQVENYDVLLRSKDQYEDNIKAMYIGTWKSDKWVNENGEEWDATYVIDEGGAGSFSDFNYAKNKTSNSGNLTWEAEGIMLKTEMHHIIFGVVPRAFKLCEIDGEICLERVGEQNTHISRIFRKQ